MEGKSSNIQPIIVSNYNYANLLKIVNDLISQNQYNIAEDLATLLLDIKDSLPEPYYYLGIIYKNIDRPVEAEIFFEKAKALGLNFKEIGTIKILDLKDFFRNLSNYTILKLPENFPQYKENSDLDILCLNVDETAKHILQVGEEYERQGFKIKIEEKDSHKHIDFFHPDIDKLLIRFDLFDTLNIYRKIKVNPAYTSIVLSTSIQKQLDDFKVFVPSAEHDLTLRFLEYVDWIDEKPDKIKHLNYIKQRGNLNFIKVLKKYTNLNLELDKITGQFKLGVNQNFDTELSDNRLFYNLSPTCQIPKLDVIYQQFFGLKNNGCFVEVGAYDGEYVSNTSGLADIGWKGFYIEPVPEYYEKCTFRHKNNSNIKVTRAAVGDQNGEIEINIGGPLSTISSDMKDHFETLKWSKGTFSKSQTTKAPLITLESFLELNQIKTNFELLVIDVEGFEWNVLKNFDIEKFHPQMVIIELHDQNDDYLLIREQCKKIVKYFDDHDYIPVYKDKTNTVYVRADLNRNKIQRMDYFMIWGHGLKYKNEILSMLRKHPDLEIISINKKKIENVIKFVDDIYSCDTVPLEHLKNKTRYLLTTPPEVLFILVKNKNPQEKYFGKGTFKHIQCQLIKDLKEEIRNKFNPRIDGKRTEDHVIHASDYESHVIHVLKVLGLPPLEYYNRKPNEKLDLPYHISPFKDFIIKEIELEDIRANILEKGPVNIEETPHYKFIKGSKEDYVEYHEKYLGTKLTDDHFPEAFDKLINEFKYSVYENNLRKLIVCKELDGKYQILDGVHRAALLKSKSIKSIKVIVPTFSSQPKTKTTAIIFSKNRAMQLHATLNSFSQNCIDHETIALKVLYKSDDEYSYQYETLKKEFSSIQFINEQNFKSDLIYAMEGSEFVLFLVDDNIFVKKFSIKELEELLKYNHRAIGYSLRLGKNTTYCYTKNIQQKLPEFQQINKNHLCFKWLGADLDFNYPFEVSSSIYESKWIKALLKESNFQNPNTLEKLFNDIKEDFKETKPELLCGQQSITFCIPVNMVQTILNNRVGDNTLYSIENLAVLFDDGVRINVDEYKDFVPDSCHQEVELKFIVNDKELNELTVNKIVLAKEKIINENFNEAEKLLLQSILIQPSNLDALNNLTVIYYYKDEIEKSKRYLKKVLFIDPNNQTAIENLTLIAPGEFKNNLSDPLISVYTVAYNAEKYISKTIESILSQTYRNFEYIIVDDGSSDSTTEIIKSYKDPRIKFFPKKHKNFAAGMNKAILESSGEFVLGVDSDDFIARNYIQNIVEFAIENPGFDYYYPNKFSLIDEEDHLLNKFYDYKQSSGKEIISKLFNLASSPIPNPGSLKKKSLFNRLELYEELDTIEDYVFLSEHALEIEFKMVPGLKGYYYRTLLTSNSNKFEKRNEIMSKAMIRMIEKFPPELLVNDIDPKANEISKRIHFFQTIAKHFYNLAIGYGDKGGKYFADNLKIIENNIRKEIEYAQ